MAVDAVAHPVDGECRLLLHLTFPRLEILHQNLLFSDATDGIVHEDRRAADVKVLLTGTPTITLICPDNVQDHTRRMHEGMLVLGGKLLCHSNLPQELARLLRHGGGGLKNRRRRALCTDSGAAHPESDATHLALHRSPLIIGIGACAALPDAARGGIHGGWLCGLCALTVLLRAESAP